MEIEEKLRRYIIEELLDNDESEAIDGESQLLLTGLVSSIGIIQLIGFIEESFAMDVKMKDVTIENFGTINRIAAYLQSHASGGNAQA